MNSVVLSTTFRHHQVTAHTHNKECLWISVIIVTDDGVCFTDLCTHRARMALGELARLTARSVVFDICAAKQIRWGSSSAHQQQPEVALTVVVGLLSPYVCNSSAQLVVGQG